MALFGLFTTTGKKKKFVGDAYAAMLAQDNLTIGKLKAIGGGKIRHHAGDVALEGTIVTPLISSR